MDINRGNYEEWMIDYVEGTLNAFEEEEVRNFLESNPNLKSEVDELELFTVKPSGSNSFIDKLSLKKNRAEIEGVSRNEYLHIQKAEGQLHDAEEQEHSVLMETTPGAKKEQALYDKVILSAEKSIVYPNKQSLKRVVLLPLITKETFNKAASIAIIILLATSIWATFKFYIIKPSLTASVKQPIKTEQPVLKSQQNKTTGREVATVEQKEALVATVKSAVTTHKTAPTIESSLPDRAENISLKTISGKGIDREIDAIELNGYEIALNEIMPLYISSLQNRKQQPVIKPVQSPSLDKTNPLLAGSVKFINRMTGNNIRFKKQYNDRGDVVAYRFGSSNLQIDHKVKK